MATPEEIENIVVAEARYWKNHYLRVINGYSAQLKHDNAIANEQIERLNDEITALEEALEAYNE